MVRSIRLRLPSRRALAPVAGISRERVAASRSDEVEDALRARDVAEHAALMRDELLAVVAHDLTTPLNSVRLWARVIRGAAPAGAEGESVRVAARIIQEATVRMSVLLHELRDVACIDTGHFGIQKEPQDVGAIVATTVDALSPLCLAKQLSIRGSSPAAQHVSCDPNRLQQVLGNLVANAIKYTPPGGTITIDAAPSERAIRFRVADTGPGIPDEMRACIFERYWRGKDQRDTITGIGLGLFISKRIVDAHGGRIWVEDAIGGGSAFCFTIPLV